MRNLSQTNVSRCPSTRIQKHQEVPLASVQIQPVVETIESAATIIDGMAMIQKVKASGITYMQLAKQLLVMALAIGRNSSRIDVVFDQYHERSIKNAERFRRSTSSLVIKSIVSTQPIQQWVNFLSSWNNKRELINFVLEQWRKGPLRFLITDGKKLFVAVNDECCCLTRNNSELIDNLNSNQEEADTKMLLHARHASFEGWRKFIIHTPDTDVFIIALSCVPKIIETGIRDKRRIIDLSAIKESLKTQIPDDTGYSIEDLLNALPGLRSFTGCDSVSSMAGKGKAKSLMSSKFVTTFVHLGEVEDLQEADFESIDKAQNNFKSPPDKMSEHFHFRSDIWSDIFFLQVW